jgi:hypothetical protein
MDVSGILTGISQTPLPTLLVVGGLVFLFLAIVGKIGAIIVVTEERQKAAVVIGSILLLLGVGLRFLDQPVLDGETKTETSSTSAKGFDEPSGSEGRQPNGNASKSFSSDGANLVAESTEAWLTGNYDVALDLFEEMRHSPIESSLRELAGRRFEWLAPYSGRILFADDFQTDSVGNGTRWTTYPGAPETGRGGVSVVRIDGESVLQMEDHHHAEPHIRDSGDIHTFVIRMRYRAQGQNSIGAHINLMMGELEGRTTVGIYGASGEFSVWETKDGREIGRKNGHARTSDWQDLRIAVKEQSIHLYVNKDLIIQYNSPRARPISLFGFNLECLSGAILLDDILMITE